MTNAFLSALILTIGVFATAGVASAGGKPDGASCHVSKSCRSKLCVTLIPTDKFGVCCTPQDCPSLNAQCGSIDNGCGTPINCGPCAPGNTCDSNQCVPDTTTTTTTSTTSSTTTTTTTSTTTLGCFQGSCPGGSGTYPGCAPGCFLFPTAENACGDCINGSEDCTIAPTCTSSSDCPAGKACVVNSCCGTSGVCFTTCSTTTTTTTTTTTSTMIPGT